MGVKTFAAINVGSYEVSMKIFEFSGKNKMKEIDYIRHSIELGTDVYATQKLSLERVEELSRVLREFMTICKGYQVNAYRAYGTSAIREMKNREIVLDQIKARTGVQINVLSNSEQRFMDYKSLASIGNQFNDIISQSTAVVDIGGGSIQVSLFEKDSLIVTQNLKIGILRVREKLGKLNLRSSKFQEVAEELILSQLGMFQKYYLKDKKIENLIVVDDYLSDLIQKQYSVSEAGREMSSERYMEFFDKFSSANTYEAAQFFQCEEEKIPLFFLSSLIVKCIMETFGSTKLCIPGVTLADGIGFEYGEKNHLIHTNHDFEQDIVGCAKNISERYRGSKKQADTIWKISSSIFDTMKRVHGLSKRDRLLLQIAVILHDCGKYVNLANDGECSYSIIKSTEIIGLSHVEREMVANIVKYTQQEFPTYTEIARDEHFNMKQYLIMSKCCAILRLARSLARSHKQKFKEVRSKLKDQTLDIYLYSASDISLEVGFSVSRLHFFEEVFSVKPVIHTEIVTGK